MLIWKYLFAMWKYLLVFFNIFVSTNLGNFCSTVGRCLLSVVGNVVTWVGVPLKRFTMCQMLKAKVEANKRMRTVKETKKLLDLENVTFYLFSMIGSILQEKNFHIASVGYGEAKKNQGQVCKESK